MDDDDPKHPLEYASARRPRRSGMDPRYRAGVIAFFGLAGISLLVTAMNIGVHRMPTPPPSVTNPWEVELDKPWGYVGCCLTPILAIAGVHLLMVAPPDQDHEK